MILIDGSAPVIANYEGPSIAVKEQSNKWTNKRHTWYLSGNLNGATNVIVQFSPDTDQVADSVSRWFTGGTLTAVNTFVTTDDVFRKVRGIVTGGTGTTQVTLEGV